ncbi:MAG: restriction endonuclease subunit S [Dorea sp.]|nr:restriction endonuclease subunit S [Dorea sp.]
MRRIKLGEVCEIVSGSTPKTGIDEYWDGDIDWITPAELTDETYIIKESQRKITYAAVQKTGLKSFPKGTVILSSRAPIGKVAIAGKEMYCNQGFKNLICSDRIDNSYLYWYLKGNTDYLNLLGRGATFKEISKTIVENIEIPLPDIHEQINCSNILKKCWDLILGQKEQIKAYDELIKSRFVEMFGDPVSNPKGWDIKSLAGILEPGSAVTYGIVQPGDNVEGGVPVFRPIDITNGHKPKIGELKRTKKEISDKYKRTTLKGYELLITVRGSIGETFQVTQEFKGCNVGRNIVPLRFAKNMVFYSFMQQLFANDSIRNGLSEITKGIALQGLNMCEFKEMIIIVPPLKLQQQFADFVVQVDKLKFD